MLLVIVNFVLVLCMLIIQIGFGMNFLLEFSHVLSLLNCFLSVMLLSSASSISISIPTGKISPSQPAKYYGKPELVKHILIVW